MLGGGNCGNGMRKEHGIKGGNIIIKSIIFIHYNLATIPASSLSRCRSEGGEVSLEGRSESPVEV